MATIDWKDFTRIDLRVGTIVQVDEFPEARKPAYKLDRLCLNVRTPS